MVVICSFFNHNLHSKFIVIFCYCSLFQSDSELVSSVLIALESIHAALAVMAHTDMPKQLYNEEVRSMFMIISSKYY